MTAHKKSQELAEAVGRGMYAQDRTSQFLRIALDEIRPGYARMTLRVTEDMVNGHGMCHGGFIFTLADSAFAFACNSRNAKCVAAGGSIQFLRPARLGDRLTASAEERHLAGRSGLYDVRVTNRDGEVIAELRGQSRAIGEVFFK